MFLTLHRGGSIIKVRKPPHLSGEQLTSVYGRMASDDFDPTETGFGFYAGLASIIAFGLIAVPIGFWLAWAMGG